MICRAAETEVCLATPELTIAWRGRVVLRGRVWAQPSARALHLSADNDGDTVRIEILVEPQPTAPVAAAWLDFHWTAAVTSARRSSLAPAPSNWPREVGWDFRWDRSPAEMRKLPPGKSVENYGHGGFDSPGVRSAFDWGEGSAAACALMATERYGEVFIDHSRDTVFGLDGVNAVVDAAPGADGFVIEDTIGRDRVLRVHARGDAALHGSCDFDRVNTGARIAIHGGK